jgi:Holliday junction resolvase RusA-like endonuclease
MVLPGASGPLYSAEPAMTVTVHLPWPISVNRLWRHKGKRVYRNPQYTRWRNEAGWRLKLSGQGRLVAGHFGIKLALSPPHKRRFDIDNFGAKPILDLLQDHGWVENDSLCQKLEVVLDRSLPIGVAVELYPISSTCQYDGLVKE